MSLKHLCKKMQDLDMSLTFSAEIEFYVLPISFFGKNGIPMGYVDSHSSIFKQINLSKYECDIANEKIDALKSGIQDVVFKNEDGLNQFEVSHESHYTDPIECADSVLLIKRVIKEICASEEMVSIFTTKPFLDQPANSMHLHIGGMADKNVLLHAIGGLMAYMPQSMYVFCPTNNCYNRFVVPVDHQQHIHYPTNYSWGFNNRTCALRVPEFGDLRIEHRVPSVMADPHKSIAVIIHAIIEGITHKVKPPEPVYGNAFSEQYEEIQKMPLNLKDSLRYWEAGEIKQLLNTK